jgi:hypothetical protein
LGKTTSDRACRKVSFSRKPSCAVATTSVKLRRPVMACHGTALRHVAGDAPEKKKVRKPVAH